MNTYLKHPRQLWLALCCLTTLAIAQPVPRATLTGQITNAADGQPLPFASVYLNGSTQGTTTNERGQFTLPNVALGSVELVISYTGFSTVRQALRITDTTPKPVAVALSPLANQLADVVVRVKQDKTWLKQLKQFEADLFGSSSYAGECVLTNPQVVEFETSGNTLFATAREVLVIDNRALGYRLRYTLQGFRSQPERITFGGTTLFEELPPATPKQARQWQRNRQEAYRGSLRHLLTSLVQGNYEKEGFMVYQSDPSRPLSTNPPPLLNDELGRYLLPFKPAEMIQPGKLPHERWLRSATPLVVLYTRYASRQSPFRDAPYAYSQLVLPQKMLGFTVAGQITAPMGFDAVGYLSNDRLGNAMPDDWDRDGPAPAIRRDSVQRDLGVSKNLDNQLVSLVKSEADVTLDTLARRWKGHEIATAPIVFAQIDKPLYLTGDRLWLSAYVLNRQAQRLDTALAGPALNAELRSGDNRLVQHQFLPVTDGRTAGMFRLADTLATGMYWLRAYTEADRQRQKPAFERPLWVVNSAMGIVTQPIDREVLIVKKEPESAVDLLVGDVPNAPFRTRISADSSEAILTLDKPMSARQPAVFALVYNRDKLLQSGRVPVGGATTRLRLSTLTWPAGLAWLSLMDSTGHVWSTRPIQVPDRVLPITVNLTLGEAEPIADKPRTLLLSLLDGVGRPVNAHVSVAVTDADKVPSDSLVADFSSHLRESKNEAGGAMQIENTPNITLNGRVTTTEKQPVNVVVMVADGQNTQVRAALTDLAGQFQVGNLTLADTAQALVRITNSRGKPIDATVQFSPAVSGFRLPAPPSGTGLLLKRWRALIATAKQRQDAEPALYRSNGGRQLREVTVRAPKPIDQRPDDIKLRSLHSQVDQTILLDEKTPPYDNLYSLIQAKVPNVRVETVLNRGVVAYSVKFSGNVASVLNASIPALASRGAPPPPAIPKADATMQNPLFLIDGFPVNDTDGTQLLMFSAGNIERVEVLKTGAIAAMYGTQASRGVIAFYTKTTREATKAKGISRQTVLGYPALPQFPLSTQAVGSQRDVLAWLPVAVTSQQGKLSVPVAVSAAVRTLRVSVQGISGTGQPISFVKLLPVN
ncbi:carboxypeptidase-like regulatory domain-containing protein [Fibrella aquatilis]|uniref:Carboxypeptidase-like regulatory domain-containing protein n=1 Tax=Fibrella aquatilis TaxID=2817059 RepID=A0A939G211_9BACT|nr:carboxypeptidase-like regulatory domain-containing protein [Fibrella aquatilis]MBO0930436.1 carboxypeptidase-like regulatory domain-containing protein [Fibrella aquatilis]